MSYAERAVSSATVTGAYSDPLMPFVAMIHKVSYCICNCERHVQICRWEFLAFSGTFKTLLNVHEERDAGRVVFSLIKSSFMKDFEGQWQVIRNANWLHALHIMPLQTE